MCTYAQAFACRRTIISLWYCMVLYSVHAWVRVQFWDLHRLPRGVPSRNLEETLSAQRSSRQGNLHFGRSKGFHGRKEFRPSSFLANTVTCN